MSAFTNFGENKIADFFRSLGISPPTTWYLAPLSAASDASVTEITGPGIARAAMPRDLVTWSGTQGDGTTLVSSGVSHAISNNIEIDMGTAASALGTVTHIGFFSASSGGNCWIAAPLPVDAQIVTGADVDLIVAVAGLMLRFGLTGGMSNFLVNKMFDKLLRGQTYDCPATIYQAAFTAAPNNAGGGTEVGGGVGYARLPLDCTSDELSGTQAPGTTSASTGTSGRISTNNERAFADPTGPWGTVGWTGFYDAPTGGNLLWWAPLASPKSIDVGVPLTFLADGIGFTFA